MKHCSFITTSTYGTWLPGDGRGYVKNQQCLPEAPSLEFTSKEKLTQPPVYFTKDEQDALFEAMQHACREFNYQLNSMSINAWHLHWLVFHEDEVAQMVGLLKNRMRQRLNRAKIWAKGYWYEGLYDQVGIDEVSLYIRNNEGCRIFRGRYL